ncbi:MAG: sensor domain-containing diguanylate cyclase [Magnetococcales bacterium]|nr:sensor domain-containing diguanylate cyclase [Magnetococcales bacterium]
MTSHTKNISAETLLFAFLVTVASALLLAILWKFGLEEIVDPWLPGLHAFEPSGERWEFVVVTSLLVTLALLVPTSLGLRLAKRQQETWQLLLSIFDRIPQPMFVTNTDRTIEMINPALQQLSGYSSIDLKGQPLQKLLHGEDQTIQTQLHQIMTQQEQWSGELWLLRRDGARYAVWMSVHTLRDSHKNVMAYIGALTDITWRKKQEQSVWLQTHHDPLTELPNRRLFLSRMQQMLTGMLIDGTRLALLLVDLDQFGAVHFTHGQEVSDLLLKEVAKRLRHVTRSEDLVARLTGDKFVILLQGSRVLEAAEIVSIHLLEQMTQPALVAGQALTLGVSISIVLVPEHGNQIEQLLELADQTMRQVKQQGGNQYMIAPY